MKLDGDIKGMLGDIKNLATAVDQLAKTTIEFNNCVLSKFEKLEEFFNSPDAIKSKKLLISKNDEISFLRKTLSKLIEDKK